MPITIDPTLNLDEPTARKLVKGLLDELCIEREASRKVTVDVMHNPGLLSSPRAQQRFMQRVIKASGNSMLHWRLDTGKKGRFRYGIDFWIPRDTLTEPLDADEMATMPRYLCAEYAQRDTRTVPLIYEGRRDRIGYLKAEFRIIRHMAIPIHALARLVMRAGCLSSASIIGLLRHNWPVLCIAAMSAATRPDLVPELGRRGWLVPCSVGRGRPPIYFVLVRDPKTNDIIVPTVLDHTMVEVDGIVPLLEALERRDSNEVVFDMLAKTPAAAKKVPSIRSLYAQ